MVGVAGPQRRGELGERGLVHLVQTGSAPPGQVIVVPT
jgi:hypothetical protein